ncbi:hypothetical protein T459_08461 [Capsicum annuum]|uniref:Uncharacterized protein n=1 Tax=Capsicum annuum TaxID=4072 RepID=A0A2G2ZWL9_CAPAN|nr:hypothetical protein T459_08461 [Capsicum annuum]
MRLAILDILNFYPNNPTLTQFIEIVNNDELANDTADHESDRDSFEDDDQMSDDDDNSDEDDSTIPSHDDSINYHPDVISYLDHTEEGTNDFAYFRDNDFVWVALWNPENPKYLKSGKIFH